MNSQEESSVRKIKNYRYQEQNLAGKGASGRVYKGINELNGQQIAIKIIEMNKIDNQVTVYLLNCEKEALLSVSSPYVLQAYEIVQTNDQCFIITPLCDGGTLKQYIVSKGKIGQSEALHIFLKLLRGYSAIKEKGFIHRDLKSSNVMMKNGQPIIIDFGYCQKTTGSKPNIFYNVGSPSYMSPEAYYKTIYSEKSDLWALGIVLYEMLEGFTIDHGQPIDRYFSSLLKNGFVIRSFVSDQLKQMLKQILNPNFLERPRVDQLIKNVEKLIYMGNQEINFVIPRCAANQNESSNSNRSRNKQEKNDHKKALHFLQQKLVQSRHHYTQMQNTVQHHHTNNQKNKVYVALEDRQGLKSQPITNHNHNFLKLTQSIYRPIQPQHQNERPYYYQPQPSVQNLSQPSLVAARNAVSLQQFQTQNIQNSKGNSFDGNRKANHVFIQHRQTGQIYSSYSPVSPVIVDENTKIQKPFYEMTQKHETIVGNKARFEYRSMMPTTDRKQGLSNLFENEKMKVCQSKIFESGEAHDEKKISENIKTNMSDSIYSSYESINQVNISKNKNDNLTRYFNNQVVQSVIIEPKQILNNHKNFQSNPVYKSVIIDDSKNYRATFPQNIQKPNQIRNSTNTMNYVAQPFLQNQNVVNIRNYAQQRKGYSRAPIPTTLRQPIQDCIIEQKQVNSFQSNFFKKAEPYFDMNSYGNRDAFDRHNQTRTAINNKIFVNDNRNLPSALEGEFQLYTDKIFAQKNYNGRDPFFKQPINFRAQQNFPQRTVMINQVIATKKGS